MPAPQLVHHSFSDTQPPAKRAQKAVKRTRMSRATRLLTEDTAILPSLQETVDQLLALHPAGTANPFGQGIGPSNPPSISYKMVLKECRKLAKDTAPGISGWTVSIFQAAFRKDSKFAEMLSPTYSTNAQRDSSWSPISLRFHTHATGQESGSSTNRCRLNVL